jgi:hypothetical protein
MSLRDLRLVDVHTHGRRDQGDRGTARIDADTDVPEMSDIIITVFSARRRQIDQRDSGLPLIGEDENRTCDASKLKDVTDDASVMRKRPLWMHSRPWKLRSWPQVQIAASDNARLIVRNSGWLLNSAAGLRKWVE